MPKCSCGKELDIVGFTRDDEGNIVEETYTCHNMGCRKRGDIRTFPLSEEEIA